MHTNNTIDFSDLKSCIGLNIANTYLYTTVCGQIKETNCDVAIVEGYNC